MNDTKLLCELVGIVPIHLFMLLLTFKKLERKRHECERDQVSLLQLNPYLSGSALLFGHILLQDYGIDQIKQDTSVYVMAHLYRAFRVSRVLSESWKETDELIDVQGTDWLFFGGFPKTLRESFQKFRLAFDHLSNIRQTGVGASALVECSLKAKLSRPVRHVAFQHGYLNSKEDITAMRRGLSMLHRASQDVIAERGSQQATGRVDEIEAFIALIVRLENGREASSFDYLRLGTQTHAVLNVLLQNGFLKQGIDSMLSLAGANSRSFQANKNAMFVLLGFTILEAVLVNLEPLRLVGILIGQICGQEREQKAKSAN